MTSVTFPVTSFKKMVLGLPDEPLRYFCSAEIHDIPVVLSKFFLHKEEDISAQRLESILVEMQKNPKVFHFTMRPITLCLTKVTFDTRKQKVTLLLDEQAEDGVYLNESLLRAIYAYRDDSNYNHEIYVEFEFISNLSSDQREELIRLRCLCS